MVCLVMHLLLTFDVEPDYTTGDTDPYRHLNQFFKDIVPVLIKKEVPAILFITNEVIKRFTEDVLRCVDFFEIGVHTHPRLHNEFNQTDKLSHYPYEVQHKMIKRDYDIISTCMGIKPKLFRAGKFAANEDTIRVLRDIGIEIDSSLTIPYIFHFKALSKHPWRAFKENNLIRIPVLAVDMRAFDLSFNLKNIWIDILDGAANCCICLHSWFAARYNNFDTKKHRFISLNQFLENERLLPVEK
jgi:peptidoglycan/xylan/chitin deacetylase (PgdA/CDA1 family)